MANEKMLEGEIRGTQAEQDVRVAVDAGFSVLVPRGMVFSTAPDEIGEDVIFEMFEPEPDSEELSDDDFTMQYTMSKTRVRINACTSQFDGNMDLSQADIRKQMEDAFINVLQQTAQRLGGDEKSVFVVRSDDSVIVIATTQSILGSAPFCIVTPGGAYSGTYYVVNDSAWDPASPAEYKKVAQRLLSTIEGLPAKPMVEESAPLLVADLSYEEKKFVTVGGITIPVPDRTKFALSEGAEAGGAAMPRMLKEKMDFVCVPEAYQNGLEHYQDASVSIFIGKPSLVTNLEDGWNKMSEDDVVSQLLEQLEGAMNKQPMTKPLEVVQKEKGFVSCYCLFSGDDTDGAFWRSYAFYVVVGNIVYSGMVYFNQEATDAQFAAAVKKWLSAVALTSDDEAKRVQLALAKERLGEYAGQNGKLDAILVARLFVEDVLFFPETKIERSSNEVHLNLQFNGTKMFEHPFLMQNTQVFASYLNDLFLYLDSREELRVPESKLHPKMIRPLLDDRLTGLSFLNLIAYHMVKITEQDGDQNAYLVAVDQNVIAGIPDAYHYICKFIKAARAYNEQSSAFTVQFVSMVNLDSPISGKLRPVAGAAAEKPISGLTVQKDGTIAEGGGITVKTEHGTFCVSLADQPPEASKTIDELESELAKDIIDALKSYSADAFNAYQKIPEYLKEVSFGRLRSMDSVINRLMDVLHSPLGCSAYYLSSTFEVAYLGAAVRAQSVEEDGLVLSDSLRHAVYVRFEDGEAGDGSFSPKRLPDDLLSAAEQLTEHDIYHSLLIRAVMAQNEGKKLIAPNDPGEGSQDFWEPESPKTPEEMLRALQDMDQIELSGTMYEGRTERIEHVKTGDLLELFREFDNPYDENAIDVRNSPGSLGHLPANVTELLAPLMDAGTVTCTASAADVEPLSKRGGRAKKGILKIRLTCNNADEADNTEAPVVPAAPKMEAGPAPAERTPEEKAAEAARRKAKWEAKKKAEEEEKRKAEEEQKKRAEEAAKLKAELEAKQKAAEEEKARKKAEQEARKKAEEEEKKRIAEEKAKKKAEEAAKARARAEELKKYAAKRRPRYQCAAKLISSCSSHIAVVKPDGTVVAKGENDYGQCNVSGWRDVISVQCNRFGTVGVTSHGTVYYTGSNLEKQNQCRDWTGIKEAGFGDGCVIGLKYDGTVVATSSSKTGAGRGDAPDVTTWTGITHLMFHFGSIIGVDQNKMLRHVGRNQYQNCYALYLNRKQDIEEVGDDGRCALLLKTDGSVSVEVSGLNSPVQASQLKKQKGIIKLYIIDGRYAMALLSDGTIFIEPPSDGRQGKFLRFLSENNIQKAAAICADGISVSILTEDGQVYWYNGDESTGAQPFGSNFRLFSDFHKMMDAKEDEERKLKEAMERVEQDKRQEEQKKEGWRAQGLCQHCGGSLKKGFFGSKCTSCGKHKDY